MRKRDLLLIVMLLLAPVAVAQESTLIDVTDKAALEAAKDKNVTVHGKVLKAEWSGSGKVCNVTFEDAPHFVGAAFEKNREKLDTAFGGDFAASMTGAEIKLSGKIAAYGGRDPAMKEATQILITSTNQVTVLTPAAPATQAAG
jgi:hypothetical protein